MEPLLPGKGKAGLADLSAKIYRRSGELKSALPAETVRREIARLVQGMNSYYSNLIEGHKTLPRDIEKALNHEFSTNPDARRNQRMSVAHVNAERSMRRRLLEEPHLDVFGQEFLLWLHGEFYSHLPEEDRVTISLEGKEYPLVPGALRDHNVGVGNHTPPDHPSLPEYLDRFSSCYSSREILETDRLVAVAAAHHRLAWIHPFGDGNGRVARLQSQAAMIRACVDGDGLWTLSRGLARTRPGYYQALQNADAPRRNDYDGRGNLSDEGLSEFCLYFLNQVLDQIEFMNGLIAPSQLQDRIESYFRYQRVDLEERTRAHLSRLLRILCMEGEKRRGEVSEILGLKSTAAREVIRKALDEELIASPTEKGPIRIIFTSKVSEYFFPNLFME